MRIAWIDIAKALGIFLVMVGHTKGLTEWGATFIYSFHMPLFFFMSGYLLKEKYLKQDFKAVLERNSYTLIVPYLCFWLVSFLYWLPSHSRRTRAEFYTTLSIQDHLVGLLYGSGSSLYANVSLWFFTCLFVTSILFYVLYQLGNPWLISVLILSLGFLGSLSPHLLGIPLPWNLDLAGVMLFFYGLGYFLSQKGWLEHKFTVWQLCSLSILLVGVTFALSQFNGRVDVHEMNFGSNLFLFYLNGCTGIGLTIGISKLLPSNPIATYLAENTIVIFPLHTVLYSIFTGIGVILFKLPLTFNQGSMLWAGLYILGAALICMPISLLIRRYMPFMIGNRSRIAMKSS